MIQPKVSVIIPVYNTPKAYIRQCLDSIVGQTLQEIEIICVDDYSTDGSLQILEEYERKDPRIVLIKQPYNSGISLARNKGAERETGEYLYYMDCDDWIDQRALEILYEKATEEDLDVLLFEANTWYETQELEETYGNNPFYCFRYQGLTPSIQTGQEWFELLQNTKQYNPMIWLQLVKTSYFKEENLSFHPLTACAGEDLVYSFQNYLSAEKMSMLQENFYNYRVRLGSGNHKPKSNQFIFRYLATIILILLEMKKKSILFPKYFDEFSRQETNCYHYLSRNDPTKVKETLTNLQALLYGTELKRLPNWAELKEIREREEEFCFFGAGERGEKTLLFFKEHNIPLPIAICDNNSSMQGTYCQGVPVISFEEALINYKKLIILVTNQVFREEIMEQVKKELSESRILEVFFDSTSPSA